MVFQCILTILPLLFHWICCAPHHGTTLAACPTNSGVSKVYCTVLPKTMDFFDEAVALWSLGLCSVYPHSCTKTGILPCSSCTTEPHQRLLHGEVSFPNSLPGKKNIIKIQGIGFGFLHRDNMSYTTWVAHRSDHSSRATTVASECLWRKIILPPLSLQNR